ncbi:MAG: hypothetical protein ACK4K0_03430 [Flavobacteriales bacterium]
MLSPKFKPFLFLFTGLIIGVLGAFTYFKYVSKLFDSPKQTIVFKSNEPYLVESKSVGKTKVKIDTVVIEKTIVKEVVKDTVIDNASLVESIDTVENILDNTIVVRSDKLISVKEIPLEIVSKKSKQADFADSLLAEKINIKPNPKIDKVKTEVWSSPINFKGYKFSQNKLVVYGIETDALIKVYKVENTYFLKTPATLYKIIVTEEFKKWVIAEQEDLDAAINGN